MINKGQIIKVKSTGTRYLLDRIVPYKSRDQDKYQFYPLEKKPHVYPFEMGKKHLDQMFRMKQFTIEQQ